MDPLGDARTAASAGLWDEVEAVLGAAVDPGREHLELLAEARWWAGSPRDAIATWKSAHEQAARDADPTAAATLCGWIALEYAALGNGSAVQGWVARGEGHRADPEPGWLSLARTALDADAATVADRAARVLEAARADGDGDLEIAALTRLGLARIRTGDLGEGLRAVDEAMAAATSGAARRLRTVGQACCDLVLATELTGDIERLSRWFDVVDDFVARRGYPDIMGFCSTCCAETDALHGDYGGAEQQLRAAVVALRETGHVARCVPPAAKLAELLVLQGRLEEAEPVLGASDDAESLLVRARLALARGDAGLAATCATRVARRLAGDRLVTVAAYAVLADARLAAGDLEEAGAAVGRLGALAEETGSPRARARAATAEGRLLLARGDATAAESAFERALDEVAGASGSVEGADAHLELARLHRDDAPDVARAEARTAAAVYAAMGATSAADEATALLRALGDRSRVGERTGHLLTGRETEVLRLVASGLTNAEIGERLFISTKTAGNHVSSILTKLGVRSRAEAAAYAILHPSPG